MAITDGLRPLGWDKPTRMYGALSSRLQVRAFAAPSAHALSEALNPFLAELHRQGAAVRDVKVAGGLGGAAFEALVLYEAAGDP